MHQVAPRPNTFMPFGSGVHACPGNELAKLEILIMIHHLVTNFRSFISLFKSNKSSSKTEEENHIIELNYVYV